MDADQLLLLLLVCGGAYFAGYQAIALGLLVIIGIIFVAGGVKKEKPYAIPAGGVRVHGAEMLEPIIVETTRGPPFRVSQYMDMRINPTWSAFDMIEKATYKGAGGLARLIHGFARGRDWE